MSRFIVLFMLLLVLGIAAGVYYGKYTVEQMQQENKGLRAAIAKEEEAIAILRADWSYLNRPARLKELSSEFLNLQPIEAGQIVGMASLPPRLPDLDQLNRYTALMPGAPRPNPLRLQRYADAAGGGG